MAYEDLCKWLEMNVTENKLIYNLNIPEIALFSIFSNMLYCDSQNFAQDKLWIFCDLSAQELMRSIVPSAWEN